MSEKTYLVEVFKVRALDTPIMRLSNVTYDSTYNGVRVFKLDDGNTFELPVKDFAFKYNRPPGWCAAPIPPPGLFEQASMRRVAADKERRQQRAKRHWIWRFLF